MHIRAFFSNKYYSKGNENNCYGVIYKKKIKNILIFYTSQIFAMKVFIGAQLISMPFKP